MQRFGKEALLFLVAVASRIQAPMWADHGKENTIMRPLEE